MSCEKHPDDGIIILNGDIEMCYGCWCEQFEYCPLCGKSWEEHPPRRREMQGGERWLRKYIPISPKEQISGNTSHL